MKNTITASIEFDFKGQQFSPSIKIELDPIMQSSGRLPDLHGLIASQNSIDLYSYEYEMMLAETITYSAAEGLVAAYVNEGVLDLAAFEAAWHNNKIEADIQTIVEKHLLSGEVQQNPKIKAALLDAYKLGKSHSANPAEVYTMNQ